MNLFLHPSLDRLYKDYPLEYLEDYGILNIRGPEGKSELLGEFSKDNGCGRINAIEGIGVGHKLMILFLIEMYYHRIEIIHLEAVPVIIRGNQSVTQEHLQKFYQKFGFVQNPIGQDPNYPHKVPMMLQNWKGLRSQVQEYVRCTTLQI